jgi:uncharacterized protein (TIRG00374 family)
MNNYIKLFGFLLLGLILLRTDAKSLAEVFSGTHVGLLFAAVIVSFVSLGVKSVRWNRMLLVQGSSYPIYKAFRIYASGFYLGLATPGRIGELARVLYLERDFKMTVGAGLSTVVLDRLLDLYALVAVGLVASFHFDVFGPFSAIFLVGVILMLVTPFFLLYTPIVKWFTRKLLGPAVRSRFGAALGDGTGDFFAGMEKMISPRFIFWWLLTALAYGLFFWAGHLLAMALAIDIGFVDATLVFGLANLLSLVPITIAGVGTRDAIFIFAFTNALALTEAQALAFSALVLFVF